MKVFEVSRVESPLKDKRKHLMGYGSHSRGYEQGLSLSLSLWDMNEFLMHYFAVSCFLQFLVFKQEMWYIISQLI